MSPINSRPRAAWLAAGLAIVLSGQLIAQEHQHDRHQEARSAGVPLYDDLGAHHRTITTAHKHAQAYFDQGLRLEYAFNHPEALLSYEEALTHDPDCASCWWGIALAAGPNINAPMSEEDGRRAYEAIRKALALKANATAREQALIEALALRYARDPKAARAPLDSAYAQAMAQLAKQYNDDADVLTLYAASLMNLNPWNYWDGDYTNRSPKPGTEQIVRALERAIEIQPKNPGACHYYIHAVEAAFPHKAVDCAEQLAALMPGAGHVVHMPGHIYIRVGRFADAVRANEHASHADEEFIADQGRSTLYTGAYYPHNYHFMAFAATMAGMSTKALEASRIVSPKVPLAIAREIAWIQNAIVLPHLTLLTFGRWDEVLAEPLPPAELEHATLMVQYARGTALAALGRTNDAAQVLQAIEQNAAGVDVSVNPIPQIARHALAGEVALRNGNADEAVEHFRAAADLEDALLYDEPPFWYYPIRHSLGRALLEADRAAEAEEAYREDLARFPENGWSLFGLAKSLDAQGKTAESKKVWTQFEKAWAHADVTLVASRF